MCDWKADLGQECDMADFPEVCGECTEEHYAGKAQMAEDQYRDNS